MIRRFLCGALVVFGAVTVGATPAAAHASLEATSPQADAVLDAPPDTIELRFTEPVEAGLGGIRVIDPGGGRADRGEPEERDGGVVLRAAVDAGDEGTYTVAWSVTSEDGHLISGSFLFSVGRETDPAALADAGRPGVRLLAAVGRVLAFAGTMALVGVVAFQVVVRRRRPKSSVGVLAVAAAAAAVAGCALVLIAQVGLSSDRSLQSSLSLVPDAVRSTRFGGLAFSRLAFALSSLGLAAVWRRQPTRLPLAALAIGALGLVAVPSISGHAWTTSPLVLAVGADVVHLLAVGLWTGGLAALLLHLRDDDAMELAARFSTLALVTVGVVVVSGSVSSYLQVRGLDGLETAYGRLLAVKVVLVLLLIGIASLTRSLVQQRQRSGVVRVVLSEVAVVVLVLAVTSVLVNRPPARSAIAQPFSGQVAMEGGTIALVQVQVQPARVGANDIHLYFVGSNGLPQPVDVVEMTVARDDIPARRVDITPVTPDHVSAYGATLPSAGRWTLSITAVRAGATSTAQLDVEIG